MGRKAYAGGPCAIEERGGRNGMGRSWQVLDQPERSLQDLGVRRRI